MTASKTIDYVAVHRKQYRIYIRLFCEPQTGPFVRCAPHKFSSIGNLIVAFANGFLIE